ncbi:hypothetical protein [Oerskovia flava]|uniref:hypothetical protein n=1 Tax=Oerskovia flava TaxID=2986422 RepID=UPI00223F23A2|nr:hypothetical protein [Oerskovia sp. JB1-3-2]
MTSTTTHHVTGHLTSDGTGPGRCTPVGYGASEDPRPDLRHAAALVDGASARTAAAGDVDWAGQAAEGYRRELAEIVRRARTAGYAVEEAALVSGRYLEVLAAERQAAVLAGGAGR